MFLAILSLCIAGLNSVNAHFAIVLRDRARTDYINTADGFLDDAFQALQGKIFADTVATAIFTTIFFIYGVVVAARPRWISDYDDTLTTFAILQFLVAFAMLVTGGYLADHVHGFYTPPSRSSAPTTTSLTTGSYTMEPSPRPAMVLP